jgi:hypothetical protein
MFTHHHSVLAAGLLVATALVGAACSDATSSDPTGNPTSRISATPSFSRTSNGGSGATAGFTVLGQAAASCTGGSIAGDVGTFQTTPPGAITLVGCPVSGGLHIGDASAKAAFTAFVAQYDLLAPKVGDCDLAHTLLSTIPASTSLPPGVYCTGAALTATDVTLTLDAGGNANATWLFKIGSPGPAGTGALTGTNFAVLLAGSAQACNVTWWVSQAATISTTLTPGSAFQGNILAGAAITLTGGSLNGNAWAGAKADATGVRVGDVTSTGTAIVGCQSSGNGNGGGGDGDDDKDHHDRDKHHDKHKHHDKENDDDKDNKHHDGENRGGNNS